MAIGTTGLVVTAAVVAAAAGAGTAWLVMETSRPAVPAAGPADGGRAELEERLAAQEKEISDLRAILEEAAKVAPPGPGVLVADHSGEVEVLDPGSAEPTGRPGTESASASGTLASLTPEERTKFEALYRELREKEQEEARRGRVAASEARLRARLDRLPDALGLTPDQKDSAVKILLDREEKVREIFEAARAEGGPDSFRAAQEKVAAVRQESRQALQALLTPDQVRAVDNLSGGLPAAGTGRFGGRPGGPRAEGQPGGRRNPPAGGSGEQPPR